MSARPAIPVIEAQPSQNWLDVSETAAEVGWQRPAFVTAGLQDAFHHNDQFLWEVLWTARYHLVDLGDHPTRFTLLLGDHEYRFVASWLENSGFLVRLEAEWP